MKILVFSDSHSMTMRMIECVEEEQPDMLFHLGDMVDDVTDLRSVFPDIPLVQVRGNNDWNSAVPDDERVELMGIRFFLTHGHRYSVRSTTDRLAKVARLQNCQIALYGHTHESLLEQNEGVLVGNPGSISMPYGELPSYMRITLTAGQTPKLEIIHVERGERTSVRDWYRNRFKKYKK